VEAVKTFLGGIEMLGKASEIKTIIIDAGFVSELERDINAVLTANPVWTIVDIKYQTAADPQSNNGIYHIALIIYKEAE
jgi:hypothetical protein